MKTAISIPDELFKKAEKTAKKHGLSRSSLYSRAIKEYVDTQDTVKITEKLDAVYSKQNQSVDDKLMNMQLFSIKEDW